MQATTTITTTTTTTLITDTSGGESVGERGRNRKRLQTVFFSQSVSQFLFVVRHSPTVDGHLGVIGQKRAGLVRMKERERVGHETQDTADYEWKATKRELKCQQSVQKR